MYVFPTLEKHVPCFAFSIYKRKIPWCIVMKLNRNALFFLITISFWINQLSYFIYVKIIFSHVCTFVCNIKLKATMNNEVECRIPVLSKNDFREKSKKYFQSIEHNIDLMALFTNFWFWLSACLSRYRLHWKTYFIFSLLTRLRAHGNIYLFIETRFLASFNGFS